MDIVCSITSEAIYESQWIQFNFDCVRSYMKSDTILIPNQTKLSLVPVTSALAYSMLHEGIMTFNYRNSPNGLENYSTRAQTVCPIYTRNVYECATIQELFTFKHHFPCPPPNDNRIIHISTDTRVKRMAFQIDRDCVVTGFIGHFQATLYKDVSLNNRTMLNARNIDCIPMTYFPLLTPQTLNAQNKLETRFWIHTDTDKQKHWYEWHTIAPIPTNFHNLNGDSYSLHCQQANAS